VNVTSIRARGPYKTILLLGVSAFLTVMAMFGIGSDIDGASTAARQAGVEKRGAEVMPFELERTMHVFQPLDDGGLQTVRAKDPANRQQIALIQSHLKEEAEKFQRGDFSDPAKIHGEDMPGLAELRAGAGEIEIQYVSLPDGAQIRYTAKDTTLVMAIHHWFMAQRADHGQHASDH
jgi:hypothetical protein